MPVVPMLKVAVGGHRRAETDIITYLQKQGTVELTAWPEQITPPGQTNALELEMVEVAHAINLLAPLSGEKKSFIESFAPYKETVTEELLQQTAREFDWRAIVTKLKALEAELANLRNLERSLLAESEQLKPWTPLPETLDRLICQEKTCLITGAIKTKSLAGFQVGLAKEFPATALQVVNSLRDTTYLLLCHLANESNQVNAYINKAALTRLSLPLSPRTPAAELVELSRLLAENRTDQAEIWAQIKAQLRHRTSLTYIYDHLFQLSLRQAVKEKMALTSSSFFLTGWLPREKLAAVQQGLKKITPLAEITVSAPTAGEVPPTLIKNRPIFYPFELITRIFGLPGQHEIDPTGPLAFFYLSFFAICLSDVGYGIILALVSYYYYRKLTLSEGGKKLLLLLFWGGLATIVAGVITGSYFAIDSSLLPPALKQLQLIDPIKNPLNVLVLSLLIGVGQNITGLSLGFYWKMKNKEYEVAIFDYGFWIYFLLALVAYVIGAGTGSPLTGIFAQLALIGAGLLVITQGRNEAGLVKKGLFGLLSLYRTTGFLGDTLSYSRLLALMMTTSIIGMVINIIAGMTRGIPVVGYIIMAAILVIGHLFNLVISVLGAFIHSARLQLVEFFGKFYEGSGREFRPFRHETKYVIIK